MMKNALGSAMAVERYGNAFFKNGAQPAGVLEHPGVLKNPEKIRENWTRVYGGARNAHRIAVLEEGMSYKPISLPPEDSQFLSTREFDVEEICRMFQVPPHLVQDLKRSTFNNIEHQGIAFVQYSLMPWIIRIEKGIINAYAAKTGLSRSKISKLMSDETWMNAKKAVELGFADGILFDEKKSEADKEDEPEEPEEDETDKEGGKEDPDEKEKSKPFKLDSDWSYSTRIMGQTILGKISASCKNLDENDSTDNTQKTAEKGLTVNVPVIGMDGKTKDGAMPYEILKAQLACMR